VFLVGYEHNAFASFAVLC